MDGRSMERTQTKGREWGRWRWQAGWWKRKEQRAKEGRGGFSAGRTGKRRQAAERKEKALGPPLLRHTPRALLVNVQQHVLTNPWLTNEVLPASLLPTL